MRWNWQVSRQYVFSDKVLLVSGNGTLYQGVHMFKKLVTFSVNLVQRYLPDPFLFCIILTLLVFVGGILMTGQGPMAMIVHWNNGFWNLLTFSMQMVLVLVTGHTLAKTPIMQKALQALAKPANTPARAILFVNFFS